MAYIPMVETELEDQGWELLVTTPDYTPQSDSNTTNVQGTVGGEICTPTISLPGGLSIDWASYKYILVIVFWVDATNAKRASYFLQDRSVVKIVTDAEAGSYDTIDKGIVVYHGSFVGLALSNTTPNTKYPYLYASFHPSTFVPTKAYAKFYGKK